MLENDTVYSKLVFNDASGPESLKDVTNIDKIPPSTTVPTATATTNKIIVTSKQKDDESGIVYEEYAIKENGQWRTQQLNNFEGLMYNTKYVVKTIATDLAGNVSESEELEVTTANMTKGTITFKKDNASGATLTIAQSPTAEKVYVNNNIYIILKEGTNGKTTYEVLDEGGNKVAITNNCLQTSTGTYYLKATTTDGINKIEQKFYIYIDKTMPTTTAPTVTSTTGKITLTNNQTDLESGIAKIEYGIFNEEQNKWVWQDGNTFARLEDNKEYKVKTRATDKAGNIKESAEVTIKTKELLATTITVKENDENKTPITPSTTETDEDKDWTNKDIIVETSPVEGTTVTVTVKDKDGNNVSKNSDGSYTTSVDGKYEITVTTNDEDGNSVEEKYYVFVDKTNPTLTLNPKGKTYSITPGKTSTTISVTASATDDGSGIGVTKYAWSTSKTVAPKETEWVNFANNTAIKNTVGGGTYYLWTTVIDNAGNVAEQTVSSAYVVKYQVVYDANGGTGAPATQTKTHGQNLTLSTTVPTRTGHTFKGWATSRTATEIEYAPGATYTKDEAVLLYPVWQANTYNITYNLNGGSFATTPPSTYTYGVEQALPTPTKTGYTFGGWYEEEALTNKIEKIASDKYGDLNIYAKWTANTYTVAYNGNGATSGSVASKSCTYDVNFTVASNGFTKTGYTFKEWNTSKTGNGTPYKPGATVKNLSSTSGATVTLYAIWEDKTGPSTTIPTATSNVSSITITFNQTDDGSGINESTIEYGIKKDGTWEWQKDATFTGLHSNTEYEIKTRASDNDGNGPVESAIAKIKTAELEIGDLTFKKNNASGATITPNTDTTSTKKWINTNIYITLNASSNGTTTYTVKKDSGTETTYTQNQTITTSTGTYTIKVSTTTGVDTHEKTYYIYVDKTLPTSTVPTATSTTGKITVTNKQTDSNSGIAKIEYGILKDGAWVWQTTNEFSGLKAGTSYEVKTRATDKAGNVKETASVNISTKELTASSITITESESGDVITPSTNKDDANKTWTNENIKIETTAPDGTTDEKHIYKEDGTEVTQNADGSYTLTDGTYKIEVTTQDEDGNSRTDTYYVFVDKTDPVVTVSPDGGKYVIEVGKTTTTLSATINVTESGSGTELMQYKWSTSQTVIPTTWDTFTSGTPVTYSATTGGNYYLWINVTDKAENKATKKITNVYKVVYKVEYDANGGTNAPASQEKVKGTNLTLSSTIPTKKGHTFGGWSTSLPATTANYNAGATYSNNAAVRLYAVWNAIPYNITYNLNGGKFNTEPDRTYIIDEQADKALPTDVSRPGYDFNGWYNTAGQKVETIPAGTIGDFTFEARWTTRTDTVYTVNYYLENANNTNYSLDHSEDKTGTTDAIITLSDVQVPTTAIPNSTYNSNSLTSTTKIDAENKTTVNVYYKRNKFKLTLVAGDNITSVTGTNSYKWGQSVTINATIANLAGYTYKWNKWTSSNTTILANQSNQSATITMPSADVTLTASATRTIIEYTITKQVRKDGVLDTNKTETIKYNVETENFELTKEDIAGYTFKGWTINDQTQLYDTITITKGSTGNNTYTAMYVDETVPSNTVPTGSSTTNEITLTFAQTDEGSGINQSTIEYGIYIDGSWKWSKDSTFSGLSADTDYKVKTRVTDNKGNGPTESLETTIRTKAVNESTLTFRKTSSTGAVVSFPTTDDSSVWVNTNIHVTLNSSTTAGVTTTYKIVNSSGTEQTLNSSNVLSTTTGKYIATVTTTDGVNTKTITYYIYVDKTKPAATVTPNGGDYTIAVRSSETTVTAKITGSDTGGSNVKTLQYAWSTSNTTTPTTWTNVPTGNQISKPLSGGTEYIWTKIVDNAGNTVTKTSSGFNVGYAIEYDANGGDTTPTSQRKEHDVNINLAEAITKTGYDFKEWNTNFDGTGTAYAAYATYTSNQAIKLYAQWTARTYSITYDLGGGTIVDPATFTKYESYTYNTEKVLPTKTDVTKPGYELDYWVDSDGNQYTTLPAGTIENITLSAHWKPTTTTYTIYHYVENINDTNYSLNSTQSNVSGVTESVVTLANLKKTITGATYKQGSLTAGGTAATTATLSGDGSTKIYLYYTRNTYTLTVNKNADIGSTTGGGTYKYGKTVAISAEFANLPGYTYTWEGWTTTDITAPTGQSTTITMPAKNVTITANAAKTVVNYSITYNLDGGSLPSGVTNPSTYTVETEEFTLNNPTQTGYTFKGWDDGSGNVSKTVTVPVGTVGNKTYTAKWTIISPDVTYNITTNGGTSSTKTTDKKDYGTAIDLTPSATKDGYTFVGWNTNKDATTALTSLTMGTSNVTLYAIFSKEVTVTYNANGGTADITQTYTMYNNQTSLSITTPTEPTTYSGWTFLCYGATASATSGNGLNEAITATVEINQIEVIYYTNWKKDINVKFIDYNGTTKTTREVNVVAYNGGTASVTAPAQNTYTGWTAKGWTPLTTTTATGTNVSGGTYTGLSANKIYYGLYHQTITLSYNLNGGTSSAIASQTGTRKVNSSNINSISNPSLKISTTTPTRSGYTFANWKDSSNNSYTSGTSYTFTKTTQISAVWNIVTYNITYDLDGGSLASGVTNPSTYTVETEKITLNNPSKTGYTFRGWQLEGETTVSKPCYINQGSVGDKKYIAIWDDGTDTEYKVEYYYQSNGSYPTTATDSDVRTGTTNDSVSVTAEDKTPTKTGYVFDSNDSNVLSGTIAADGSLVLKVYFKQQFTVTYKAGSHVSFTTENYSNLDYGVATPSFKGTVVVDDGYKEGTWTPNIANTVTSNVEYVYNSSGPRDDTPYKVEYYYQENGQYPATPKYTDISRTGTTDTSVTLSSGDKTPTETGYAYDQNASNVTTGKIAGNGSLVLKVYFKQQFTVTYKAGTNVTFTTETYSNLDYGVATPAFEGTPTYAAGYGNGVWTPTKATTVTADATYTLNAQANTNTKYTVEYYYQTNGKYPTTATSSDATRTGTTAKTASVTAADKTPTKTGYVFDSNASNVLSGTIAGNGSLVLKVYFKQQFTVTYKAGTNVTFTTETYSNLDYGVATPAFEGTPTYAAGYGNGVWTPTKATTVTADATYTLNAQANTNTKYTVEYYYQTNGKYPTTATSSDATRTGTTAKTASVTAADKTPTKTGYVFDSNASNVLSGTIAGNGSLVLKVYFKQQFTVKYLKGTKGTFTEETYTNLDYGTATPAFSGTKTGAAGYTFSKWSPTVATKVTANATYTAVFTANPNTSYTVHVYGENAENTNYTFIKNVTKTGTTDSTINVSTIKDSLEGYGKDSIVAKDANGNTITTFTVNGNGTTEVYLYYSRNKYTLNLVAGTNIKTVTGAGTYKWGSTVNISATMDNDSGNTYNWLNWTSSDKTILADQADQNATITMPIVPDGKKLTLTANATANANEYSITYENLQGATNSQNPSNYIYGTTVTFNNPGSRPGYTFKGWYEDSEYTTQITGISATQKGNVTVYAKWETNKYKVTYNAMGGTCDTGIIEDVPYNTAIDLSIVAKKPGYVFIGWNTNENATIKLNSLKMGTSDVTLYAIYHEAVAQMGDKYYETLQEAINEAGTTASTITVLKSPSTQEVKTYSQQETQATIAAGQNITLKMEGNTIESTADTAIINNGTLTIENGTVKSTADTAIINNGTLTIKTGTVSSTTGVGIIVNGGTVNIGINEATPNISVTNPTIIGSTKGIEVKSGTLNFYDGQIKGPAEASISGTVTGMPTGCVVVKNTSSDIETAVLGYTITYNHNETRNYIAANKMTRTISGFTGSENQLFPLGKLFIDDLKVGDKIQITFDATYTDLTAATNQTASFHINGEGDATAWNPGLGTTSETWSGEGTATYTRMITITENMLKNTYYALNFRADYYASGSITISNLKAVRVATQTVTRAKGATLGTLPTISNTTYTLKGWYTSATGGTKVSSSTVVNGNATYYAQWDPIVASTTIGSTTTKYSTVQAAVDAAGTNSGATVTLLEPRRDESITIASGQNINFDLNGRILESTTGVTITNNGTLTLKGSGKVSGSIADTIVNNGTFVKNGTSTIDNTTTKEYRPFRNKTTSSVATLNEGTLTCSNTEIGTAYRYIIVNVGTLTVAGATIKADVANSGYERGIINNAANAKVIVNSGNIITNGMAIYNGTGSLNTTSSPAIKIAGGTIESKKAETIYNGSTGMIYLTGGTINQNNTSSTVHNNSGGIIQVSGATIQQLGTRSAGTNNGEGTLKVTSGSITGNYGLFNKGKGTIEVTGGSITGASYGIYNETTGTISVSGGSVTGASGIWNNASGEINITGGKITANGTSTSNTGVRIYTGTGTISGVTEIIGKAYGASVQGGELTIQSGSVKATNGLGIWLSGGTLTLGTNETTPNVSVTNPTIIGTTNGVKVSSGTFNFYDGQIKGAAGGSISGTVADKPTGYAVVKSTSSNIETAVLGPSGITITAKYENASGSTYTSGTWTNKSVYVTVSIENAGAGIKQYEWKEGSSGTWKTSSLTTSDNGGTIKFTANRNSTIYFRAIDNNNVKTVADDSVDDAVSIVIKKETTLPTVTLGKNGGTSKILVGYSTAKISTTLTASDTGGSGLKTLQYAWSQSNTTEPTSWTTFTSGSTVTKDATGGNWYLWTKVLDNAGNRATSVKISNVFKVTYQVLFDGNGGTVSTTELIKTYGTELTITATATRTGYTFKGWGTSATTISASYSVNSAYKQNGAIKLFAVWQGTATFDKNYLDTSLWNDTYLMSKYRAAETAPSSKTTVTDSSCKYGQYLEFTMPAGTSGGPYYNNSTSLTVGKTYTWSVFVKASSAKTLYMGQEQGGRKSVNITTSWQKFTYTFTATEYQNKAFTFYLTSGSTWTAGDKLYVHSLEIMEGTPTTKTTSATVVNGTLGTLTTPTRTGYAFQGWYDAPSGGNKVSSTTKFTANTTYYAHWTTNNYTITYKYNSSRNYIGANNTTTEITGFTGRDNYSPVLGKLFIDDLDVGDKLQISFDATHSNLTAATDQTASLRIQGAGNSTGWTKGTIIGSYENWINSGTEPETKTYTYSTTITADMKENTYLTISLRTNYYASGSITITNLKAVRVTAKTESKPYGTQLGTLPTIDGTVDTLNGWYTAASGGTKIATTTVVTGNATYYAQWTRMVASTTIGSTTTKYSTVQAAVNAAGTNSGATVTLLEPRRTENITIASGQNIILNTNNRILSNTSVVIACSGSVSINGGGKIEGTTTNPAVINASSGTVTIDSTTVTANSASAVRNESTGNTTIESGTFKSIGTNASTVANTGTGTTTINGGTILSETFRAITITKGNLIVGKSTETSTTSPAITATSNYAIASTGGSITVYGGKIRGTRCINYNGSGSIRVQGGDLTSTDSGTIYITRASTSSSGAILSVTGGSVSTSASAADAIINQSNARVDIGKSSSTSQTSPSIKGRVYSYYADSSSNVLTTGRLNVYSGLITATTQHAIYATGPVYIEGGKMTASKNHTVILGNNNSASMEIRGNPIIENTSTYRAASTNNLATQNLDINMSGGSITSTGGIAVNNEKGTTKVYGGTITGKTYGIYTTTGTIYYRASISTTNSVTATGDAGVGIYATTGTINLGLENNVLQEKPKIKGKKYGIQITETAGTLNFYDCIVYGGTSAIANAGTLNVKSGYGINISTETTTIGTASVSCEKKMLVEANFLNYTTKSYYSNLTDAINTATSGDSIFVNKTVTDNATSAYNINKKIDLVIFSSDITLNVNQEFNVTSSGNLSFSGSGGRIESTAAVGVRNAGKFSFVNQFGYFKSTGECIYNNGGSVVIDGPGTNVTGHTTLSSSAIYTINNYRGSVEIKDASVYNSSDNGYGIYNKSGSTLTISGAYIIGYSGINNNGNAIVNSGDIIGRKSKGILNNGGTLTLGTTSASVTSQDSSIVPVVKGNAMGISGGTMNFYSGVVYGGLFAISDNSTTVVPRDGYSVLTTTADTSIDGTTYTCKRAMLSK